MSPEIWRELARCYLFIEKMEGISETELNYIGIAICGAKKKANKLTGSNAVAPIIKKENLTVRQQKLRAVDGLL